VATGPARAGLAVGSWRVDTDGPGHEGGPATATAAKPAPRVAQETPTAKWAQQTRPASTATNTTFQPIERHPGSSRLMPMPFFRRLLATLG
jgi:hypothetical protein